MAGNVVATVPLTLMLSGFGWSTTFAIAGGISLAYALLLLRPGVAAPYAHPVRTDGVPGGRRVLRDVRGAWRLPAGRLAFWVHLSTMAGPTAFAVLWGFPYLTQALGTPGHGVNAAAGTGRGRAGGELGHRAAAEPAAGDPRAAGRRGGPVVLSGWLTLILWPAGRPPFAVVVLVVAIFSVGGPASSVGFMLARDYNPVHRISTATGLVNIGGFFGSVAMVFAVGQILDWAEPGVETHSVDAYRLAFVAIATVTALGIFRMVTWLLRTRPAFSRRLPAARMYPST